MILARSIEFALSHPNGGAEQTQMRKATVEIPTTVEFTLSQKERPASFSASKEALQQTS